MKRFADLYDRLDSTTSTSAKVAALADYFRTAPPEDAAWAVYFLTGQRLKRLVGYAQLRDWTLEASGLSDWLLEESVAAVGDVAETIALLIARSDAVSSPLSLSHWLEERLLPLRETDAEGVRERILAWWRELPARELLLLNKMLTGELRVGVSQTLVVRALAVVAAVEPPIVAHRLMGHWQPSGAFFRSLLAPEGPAEDVSRPYPFFLASPLEQDVASLGDPREWLVEWKWDGIRAQCLQRADEVFLWSRGEELVTERFPEVELEARRLPPGTVLDGEILAWRDGRPLPFALLQRRIGRKELSPRVLEEAPVSLVAYDLLEENGVDVRARPLAERRAALERLLERFSSRILVSPAVVGADWQALARLRDEARDRGVEGFMVKRLSSVYRAGRPKGDWWKWKIDPFHLDAVLVYAHPGHGRRASLFTDYTFAVWRGDELVPIAKAYSGLSDEEIAELDRWIRSHTRERFGPVRAVEPVQVFELAFEDIRLSSRHKAGIAVRFPRIARWRKDKPAREADTLEGVRALLGDGG